MAKEGCLNCGAPLRGAIGVLCPKCLLNDLVLGDTEGCDDGAAAAADKETAHGRAGSNVGRYRLIETVGEGGFGVVYRARQIEPMRRVVALKILKYGMATAQVIQRFELERQSLALMEHPNIAKVLDAGESEDGSPYFVMEFVDGVPITDFCDRRRLDLARRISAFIDVCSAVQHAHQKGIIHRDLKPSNILVGAADGNEVPKIIDFGIAKATERKITAETLYTQIGQFMGTPNYVSPEQATLSAVDIDTRSDIYSLGVILYELLTGSPPIDCEDNPSTAVEVHLRAIREQPPQKPSTRLRNLTAQQRAGVASDRSTDPSKLSRVLRGDLDWILLKALEKDRDRRYQTADALRDDLGRFLGGDTVHARPPTTAYRLGKFLRRHRLGVFVVLLLAGSLLAGLAVSTIGFSRARKAQALSESVRAETRERLYAADMLATEQALADGDLALAKRYLEAYLPDRGDRDLRTFPWHHFWNQAIGDQLETLRGHGGVVTCVAFSTDGGLLASGDRSGSVLLHDASSYSELARVDFESPVASVAFDAGDSLLAVGTQRETFVFQLDAGAPPALKYRRPGSAGALAFLPDSTTLLVGSETNPWGYDGGTTIVWHYESGLEEDRYPNAGGRFSLSSSGILFTGVRDGKVRKWDAETGDLLGTIDHHPGKEPHNRALPAIGCSPDGKWLVTASGDRPSLTVLHSGETLEAQGTLLGNEGFFITRSIAFAPDGRFTTGGLLDNLVRLWDPRASDRNPTYLRGHAGPVLSAAFSSDGGRLATASADKAVHIWDPERGHRGHPLLGTRTSEWDVGPALSPDGSLIATRDGRGTVGIWEVETMARLGSLDGAQHPIRFSADGKTLIAVGDTLVVKYFDVETLGLNSQAELSAEDTTRRRIAISDDGSRLTLFRQSGTGEVWDLENRTRLAELDPGSDQGLDVQYVPDGERFVSAHWEGVAALWDGGRLVHKTARHTGIVFSAAVSPDGAMMATGSSDGAVRLVELDTGRPLVTLQGHKRGVRCVRFSPAGDTLASSGQDGVVRLWDTRTWRRVGSWEGELGVPHLTFSEDGSTLAIVEGTWEVRVHFLRAPADPGNAGR